MPVQVQDESVDEKLARLVVELRRHGYRVTAQRLAIARIVFQLIKEHPSFMQIVEAVRRNMPSISPSTIYNNLQLLERLGFIKSFDVAGETRYDEAKPHVNVVCIDRGEIIDIEDEAMMALVEQVTRKYGLQVREVVVEAYCGHGSSLEDSEGASGPG